jgi:hypothetical protein
MPGEMRKPTGGTRPPSLRGSLMVDTTRGSLRVRAWPRKRGPDRHPTNVYWTQWLRYATYLYTYQPGKFKAALDVATAGTPWMPRDVFIASLRGRAFTLRDDNGRTYYPMPARQDISDSLDAIAQLPGEMMYRSSGLWVPVPSGEDGQVLTYRDSAPAWEAPATTPNPYLIVPIIMGADADNSYNINSTSFVFNTRRRFFLDAAYYTPSYFRLECRGQANAAGQTVTIAMHLNASAATPLNSDAADCIVTNSAGQFASGWLPVTASLSGWQQLDVGWKGSNSTVDIIVSHLTVSFR